MLRKNKYTDNKYRRIECGDSDHAIHNDWMAVPELYTGNNLHRHDASSKGYEVSHNLIYIASMWKDLLSYNDLPECCKPEGFEGDVNEKRYFFMPQEQDSHNLNDVQADYIDADKEHPVAKKFHVFNKMRKNLFGDIVFLAVDKSGRKYKVLYVNSYLKAS